MSDHWRSQGVRPLLGPKPSSDPHSPKSSQEPTKWAQSAPSLIHLRLLQPLYSSSPNGLLASLHPRPTHAPFTLSAFPLDSCKIHPFTSFQVFIQMGRGAGTVGRRTQHCGRRAHCRVGRDHSGLLARAENSSAFMSNQREHELPNYSQIEQSTRILTEVKA